MCWNKDISINTFMFSFLALLFIFFTNTYTKYKTSSFKNPLVYLFLFAVVLVQLTEFFLWKNLNNKINNYYLSKVISFLIFIQMFLLILMIPNLKLRYMILILFIMVFTIYYYMYKGNNLSYTYVGKNGHLSWNWMNYKGYDNIWLFVWLLFYIIPCLLLNNFILSLFVLSSMVFSLFFYFKSNTFGTMWCWSSNLLFLYFIVDILIIQPFYEYNGLC